MPIRNIKSNAAEPGKGAKNGDALGTRVAKSSPMRSLTLAALRPFAALVALLAMGACGRNEHSRHVTVASATAVPSDVIFYPHVLYGGDAAYLVDGKWYRPGVNGWLVFTAEPLELELVRRALE